jgi:hypothetical protein
VVTAFLVVLSTSEISNGSTGGCKKPVRCCEGERGWTGKFRGLLVVAALETGQGLIGKDL